MPEPRAAAGTTPSAVRRRNILFVTTEEMRAFNDEMLEILMRYHSRLANPEERPEGSLPVEVLVFRYPLRAAEAN